MAVPRWVTPDDNGISSDRTHGIRGRPKRDPNARVMSKKELGTTSQDNDDAKAAIIAQARIEFERPPLAPAHALELPSFSGLWKCVSIEGDWDSYLQLLGVPMLHRRMAFGTSYGKGRALQRIDQDGFEAITVTSAVIKSTYRETLRLMREASQPTREPQPGQPPPPQLPLVKTRLDGSAQLLAPPEGGTGRNAGLSATVAWEGKSIVTRMVIGAGDDAIIIKRIWFDPPGQQEGKPEWQWGKPSMVMRVIGYNFIASRTFQLVDDDGDFI